MCGRRLFPRLHLFAVAFAIAILAFSLPASATASSGILFLGNPVLANGQIIDGCAEAIMADVADSKAFNYAYAPVGAYCSSPQDVLPAGYLGVQVLGYRNGQFCGATALAYSPVPTSGFGIGALLCSNPSGLQSFYSRGYVQYYAGPSYPYENGYVTYPGFNSPSQSY